MYRTLLHHPLEGTEVTGVRITDGDYTTRAIYATYSESAYIRDGKVVLVSPVTDPITSDIFGTLKNKYVEYGGAVYYVQTVSTTSNPSTSEFYAKAAKGYLVTFPEMRIFSGADQIDAIQSAKITAASNNGDNLTFGSVCTSCLEVKIINHNGDITIPAGTTLNAYKVADDGTETQIGVYNVEKSERVSKHIYKITAYDNVRKLDADITEWLRGLTGWPYAITDFYGMLCEHFELSHNWSSYSTVEDFMVYQFDVEDGTTGRQLMGWICECMGNYCIARPDGGLISRWYKTGYIKLFHSKSLMPGTNPEREQFYYQGSLSYGDFVAQEANYAQVRVDSSVESVPWPDYSNVSGSDKSNMYVITGNPILLAHPTYQDNNAPTAGSVNKVLAEIADRYDSLNYVPFRVTIPENPTVNVGDHVLVYGENNKGLFVAPIAEMVWSGHKMTLECHCKRTRRE